MDDILSAVLEFLLEAVIGTPMESDKVKTWVKTTIMTVLFGLVAALLIFGAYVVYHQGDRPLFLVLVIAITVWWIWTGIRSTIDGHKRGWKKDRDY